MRAIELSNATSDGSTWRLFRAMSHENWSCSMTARTTATDRFACIRRIGMSEAARAQMPACTVALDPICGDGPISSRLWPHFVGSSREYILTEDPCGEVVQAANKLAE